MNYMTVINDSCHLLLFFVFLSIDQVIERHINVQSEKSLDPSPEPLQVIRISAVFPLNHEIFEEIKETVTWIRFPTS